jgi:hypothetical protein
MLPFILQFKVSGQATVGGNMSPFHRDMGFSRTEIGIITNICGVRVGSSASSLVARDARRGRSSCCVAAATCGIWH